MWTSRFWPAIHTPTCRAAACTIEEGQFVWKKKKKWDKYLLSIYFLWWNICRSRTLNMKISCVEVRKHSGSNFKTWLFWEVIFSLDFYNIQAWYYCSSNSMLFIWACSYCILSQICFGVWKYPCPFHRSSQSNLQEVTKSALILVDKSTLLRLILMSLW